MAALRVGIIGGGRIADLHALGYRDSLQAEICTVCDVNEHLARSRAREWRAERWFTDYRELLADPAVDAVEIITPHYLHAEMTVAALEAGKHVSVQKPMALTVTECDAMIAAAKRTGKNLRVFENFRYYPAHAKAKELLESGAVGEPLSIRVKSIQGSLGGGRRNQVSTPDRRVDAREGYPLPLSHQLAGTSPSNWKYDSRKSGGGRVVLDGGYHIFSLALFYLGDVEKVFA
ncbi:MAG: Gfo/Idh/MocA family oxidoreductase, partial [Dehalococcoidales bacterium]|nr:Gfo/Idh/MocA family oxidoreductase [Dehalococcoidales bacterium]